MTGSCGLCLSGGLSPLGISFKSFESPASGFAGRVSKEQRQRAGTHGTRNACTSASVESIDEPDLLRGAAQQLSTHGSLGSPRLAKASGGQDVRVSLKFRV